MASIRMCAVDEKFHTDTERSVGGSPQWRWRWEEVFPSRVTKQGQRGTRRAEKGRGTMSHQSFQGSRKRGKGEGM